MEAVKGNPLLNKEKSNLLIVKRIAVALFLLALAMIMSHAFVPLNKMAEHSLYGDYVIFSYILCWGAHAIFQSPLHYYDPPIFYPSHNMLPGTDGLELPALLLSPVWYLFHNPILLVNVAGFAAHLFSLIAGYFSVRKVFLLPRTYALVLTTLFSVSTDHFWHSTGHLNLIWSGILPLIFTGVWLTLGEPRKRYAILLGCSIGSAVYFSVYFFVLGGLIAAVAALGWVVHQWALPRKRNVVFVGLAILAGLALAAPKILIYKQASSRSTQVRASLVEAASYSATPMGYLQPVYQEQRYISWWYRIFHKDPKQVDKVEDDQFIGYFFLLLLGVELIRLTARVWRREFDRWDRLSLFAVLCGGFLVCCSFGPTFYLPGFSPYRVLYAGYLQFSGFYRVPARLAFVVQWIAIIPVAVLLIKVSNKIPRPERLIAVLPVTGIILFEHLPAELPAQFKWDKNPAFAVMDSEDPAGEKPCVVLNGDLGLYPLLSNTKTWRPAVNGWQGSPLGRDFDNRLEGLLDFPTTGSLAWLASNNVHYIVAEGEAKARAEGDRNQLKTVDSGSGLYSISSPENLKAAGDAMRASRSAKLAKIRTETSSTIEAPPDRSIVLAGGDGLVHQPDGRIQFAGTDSNRLSILYAFQGAAEPAAWDKVVVTYRVIEGASNHQANLYWRPQEAPINEERTLGGTVVEMEGSQNTWQATFPVSQEYHWIFDSNLAYIRFDFSNFAALEPVRLEILKVQFVREKTTPEIPLM